ncbi:ParB/RepB/Spo0J family partition protein [Amycolatopsis anabasis]|uniref:ParB/RepB/Spo0J family partition protein n=1 Tax=Amycolatopsis anabasis TaxID=1840409 RepID=UPI00131AFD21|nr:ParB/RepB/Spo0J family partition protein [Amycolatopsis anabasis]
MIRDAGQDDFGDAERRSGTVPVPIDELLPADSPRLSGEDSAHTRALAETNAILPPILVHRPTMRVIDGMHRLWAAKRRKLDKIEAQFFEGTPEEAFVLAVESNIGRGLPLSLADREAAAARVIASYPQWSDRAIASRTGLAARTVSVIRMSSTAGNEQLNARVGLDGRVRPLNCVAGRLRASEVIAAQPDASLRTVAREAGISVGTARDVRQRLSRGESPIPAGLRPAGTTNMPAPAQRPDPPVKKVADGGNEADLLLQWQKLAKDPSLRFTETGRALLRWLSFQAILPDELDRLMDAVPGHGMESVRRLALRCAGTWQRFADELEERGRASA